jgi:hypothetical protein
MLLNETKNLPRNEQFLILKEFILLAMMAVDLKSIQEDKILHIAS